MKIIAPSALLREAADVLAGVRDHVVVIGAAAVQVALDGEHVALTPTRDADAGLAERDYSDAALLLDRLGPQIAAELPTPSPMRQRVHTTAQRLLDDDARAAAARELLRTGQEQSRRAGEAVITRAAQRMLRRLED